MYTSLPGWSGSVGWGVSQDQKVKGSIPGPGAYWVVSSILGWGMHQSLFLSHSFLSLSLSRSNEKNVLW